MTKLNELQNHWIEKMEEGDEKYLAITRTNNTWHVIVGGRAESIKSLSILVERDDGLGFVPDFTYPSSHYEEKSSDRIIMIKKEKKMIISDEKSFYSFGIKDAEERSPIRNMMIYVRTATVHTFIYASRESDSICVSYSLAFDDADAITHVMRGLFSTSNTNSIKEVTAHEQALDRSCS